MTEKQKEFTLAFILLDDTIRNILTMEKKMEAKNILMTEEEMKEEKSLQGLLTERAYLDGILICFVCNLIKEDILNYNNSLIKKQLSTLLDYSNVERDIINMLEEATTKNEDIGLRLSDRIKKMSLVKQQETFEKVVRGIYNSIQDKKDSIPLLNSILGGLISFFSFNLLNTNKMDKDLKSFLLECADLMGISKVYQKMENDEAGLEDIHSQILKICI